MPNSSNSDTDQWILGYNSAILRIILGKQVQVSLTSGEHSTEKQQDISVFLKHKDMLRPVLGVIH